ncbi:hypothetical protein KSX_17110 [Ktedonospora formicarum]|uniref:Major facilitator superfamily (MFS) profile domain-containing protein n=2 Tax=Ktedonospora formicarum TaxID=2778364 RepID=A0A8J3HZV9_9CHLR|nr:hypothetical protein KSX_17110 [Ktedonospora formicarum]
MALVIGINLVAYRGHSLMALVCAVMLIYVPQRVVAPLSGRLADKLARRNLLLAANGSLMGLSFVLWWLQHDHQLQHDHPLWWLKLYALQVVIGLTTGVLTTAESAFVQEMVSPRVLVNAQYVNGMVSNAGQVLGSALSSWLASKSYDLLFAFNGASFLLMLLVLFGAKAGREKPLPKGDEAPMSAAWEYIKHPERSDARWALLVYGTVCIFCFNGLVLQPLIGYHLLGGENAYTMLALANAIGALVGSLVLSLVKTRATVRWLLAWCVWNASFLTLYGASFSPPVSMVCLGIASIGGSAIANSARVIVVEGAPNELLGRLYSIYGRRSYIGQLAANLLAASVAAGLGIRAAATCITAAGVIVLCALGAFYLLRSRSRSG